MVVPSPTRLPKPMPMPTVFGSTALIRTISLSSSSRMARDEH
jgi:hypothetical protein